MHGFFILWIVFILLFTILAVYMDESKPTNSIKLWVGSFAGACVTGGVLALIFILMISLYLSSKYGINDNWIDIKKNITPKITSYKISEDQAFYLSQIDVNGKVRVTCYVEDDITQTLTLDIQEPKYIVESDEELGKIVYKTYIHGSKWSINNFYHKEIYIHVPKRNE